MSISKVLRSNNLVFFVIALVLMGFAVHSLGKRKNTVVDGLIGNSDLQPDDLDDIDDLTDSHEIHSGQMVNGTQGSHHPGQMENEGSHHPAHAVAPVASSVPKPTHTDPKELLPKDKSDAFHNKDLINAGRFISQQSETLRNANLQIRSDPPVGKSQTGPWNQTTITPDKMRPQFELGSTSGIASVSGFSNSCSLGMSSSILDSNNAILPPSQASVSE